MTTSSNAFNFLSFLQHSVDPRTGQYTMSIELPELAGNALSGPALPLRLDFNPINEQDSGFGHGWSLNLSQYDPATAMLTLHSGESYKVTGSGDQPAIRERKLDSFHFHKEPNDRFRLVHKNGLVEILEVQGPTDNRVALPVRVEAPSGHWIDLSYVNYLGIPCLSEIVDAAGVKLLALTYNSSQVLIKLHPQSGAGATPLAVYEVNFRVQGPQQKRLPFEVVLPSDDRGSWRLEYEFFDGRDTLPLACLKKIETPTGGTELIEYDSHLFPPAPKPEDTPKPLPRVRKHTIKPGFGQPDMVTEYTYTTENFLGYGATGVVWSDDGQDNLYQFTGASFSYGSTATRMLEGAPLRKITRLFNRFHLLTWQSTEQDDCIEEIETTFNEQPNRTFDQQPNNFQLPTTVTKRWRTSRTPPRSEVLRSRYDQYGNLLEETLPSGIRTTYEYYPATGEEEEDESGELIELCPADPQGFVRSLKSTTTHPGEGGDAEAATLQTRYRYYRLPPVAQSTPEPWRLGWLVVKEEDRLQLDGQTQTLLRQTQRFYLDRPDSPLLHGRVDYQLETLKHGENRLADKTSRMRFFYSLKKDAHQQDSLLHTKITAQGHDLAEKSISHAVCRHTGSPLSMEDLNGVFTDYAYDAMGRVVAETIAPGTPYEATRSYRYQLCSATGQQSNQTSTDVQGVKNRTWFDGSNRSLWEEREVEVTDEASNQPERKWFRVSDNTYDGDGRLTQQTQYDDYLGQKLALTSSFEYNAWGDQCKTIGPDGVINRYERSPFGAEGDIVETWQERPDQPAIRRGWQRSEYNRFGNPTQECRLESDEQQVGSVDFFYDGLGRCVRQVRKLRDPLKPLDPPMTRTTLMRYDVWDRMYLIERPDGSSLAREFASHSTDELTTRLELLVAGQEPGGGATICRRGFDGLGRISSLTVGPRTERYTYHAERELLRTHERTSGRHYTFSYQPELGSQPTSVNWKSERDAEFEFDKTSALVTKATNSEGVRTYSYTDQGYLREETWQGNDASEAYNIAYCRSLQGSLHEQRGSDGLPIVSTYDKEGRLHTRTLGQLEATLCYDEDGRLGTTTTTDSGRTITCTQTYDLLGRDDTRRISLDDGTEQLLTMTWRDDDLLHQRTLHQGDTLLLEEKFQYDQLDRLTQIDYVGSELPCNRAGRPFARQRFRWDALDNLTRCDSSFADGKTDSARFTYAEDGSCQLTHVTHSLQPDYPASQAFSYDADGNMLNDEWGRRLDYDDRGRLLEIRSEDDQQCLARYRYDAHDHLLSARHGNASEVLRRYQGYNLSATLERGMLTQYLLDGERPLAQQSIPTSEATPGQVHAVDSRLLLTDAANSVIGEYAEDGLHTARYSAYGEQADTEVLQTLLAFNGEVREHAVGWYLLGRGYRAYNPDLMRFHSPDSLAPEESGINPYVYALGNPVQWRDPTGHRASAMSSRDPHDDIREPVEEPKASGGSGSWYMIGASALILVVSAIPVVGALAMGAALTVSMGIALAGIAAETLALGAQVGSMLTEGSTSEALKWTGVGLTALGVVLSLAGAVRGFKFMYKRIVKTRPKVPKPSNLPTMRTVGTGTDPMMPSGEFNRFRAPQGSPRRPPVPPRPARQASGDSDYAMPVSEYDIPSADYSGSSSSRSSEGIPAAPARQAENVTAAPNQDPARAALMEQIRTDPKSHLRHVTVRNRKEDKMVGAYGVVEGPWKTFIRR